MMFPSLHKLRRFARDTDGATLTELAIVVPLLLLLVLGAMEFGRFGFNETLAQKATDLAARTAAVRPSACDGVDGQSLPENFLPPQDLVSPPRFGTLCRIDAPNTCAPVPEVSCNLLEASQAGTDDARATADEIWRTVSALLPSGATRENLVIRYSFDDELGFLGGPYTPVVTVELENLEFQFISPLGALAALAGADGEGVANSINFPRMSASLPAEDLGQGIGG